MLTYALAGALPAHFLAPGAFTAAQRGGALLYKGTMFWMVRALSLSLKAR
jgi:hypothetical protein